MQGMGSQTSPATTAVSDRGSGLVLLNSIHYYKNHLSQGTRDRRVLPVATLERESFTILPFAELRIFVMSVHITWASRNGICEWVWSKYVPTAP